MARPKINKIKPFDARNAQAVTFSWSGNQSYGNRVIIYDKESMNTVYDGTVETFTYSHTIPAGTLENGKCYIIQCQVYDMEGIESPLSDKYYFYVFQTPSFTFDGLDTGIVRASSFKASVTYYQADFEALRSYKFAIYDSAGALLLETDTRYDVNDLTYTYRGLENDTTYYIRCTGVTVNGMEVDTGLVRIFASYEAPNVYSRLYSECDYDNGCVEYRTNINIIEPSKECGGDFTFQEGKIDLTDRTLIYDDGFTIDQDFTLKLKGTQLNREGRVITLRNSSGQMTITGQPYPQGQLRYRLTIPNSVSKYILYSNPLSCPENAVITIVLRRRSHIYELKAYIEGGDS